MWNFASYIDLIVMLSWPLALSSAAWFIAKNALAETDEISGVVKALTRVGAAEEDVEFEVDSPPGIPTATPVGGRGWIGLHLNRARRGARNVSRAKVRTIESTFLRHVCRRGIRAAAARILHFRELSEKAP